MKYLLIFLILPALLLTGCGGASDNATEGEGAYSGSDLEKTLGTECELLKWGGDAYVCWFTHPKSGDLCTIYEYGRSGGLDCSPKPEGYVDPASGSGELSTQDSADLS